MRASAALLPAPPYFHFRKKIGERVVFASTGMRFAFLPVQATAGNYTFVPISRTNMPLPAAIHASRVIHRGQAISIPIAPAARSQGSRAQPRRGSDRRRAAPSQAARRRWPPARSPSSDMRSPETTVRAGQAPSRAGRDMSRRNERSDRSPAAAAPEAPRRPDSADRRPRRRAQRAPPPSQVRLSRIFQTAARLPRAASEAGPCMPHSSLRAARTA